MSRRDLDRTSPAASRPETRRGASSADVRRFWTEKLRVWRWPLGVLALLAIALVAIYWPALNSPLIYDDISTIQCNRSIERLWPLWGDGRTGGPLAPLPDLPISGRPLVNLSLAVDYHFHRSEPLGFHVANLGWHLLTAALLVAILRRLLRLERFAGRFESSADWLAFSAVLVWAVHPLLTEAVIYITQRTELMASFFYLAIFYAGLRYWSAGARRGRMTWLLTAFLASQAAMASKQTAASVPLLLPLLDWFFRQRSWRELFRAAWPLYLAVALGWPTLLALNWHNQTATAAGFGLTIPATTWWLTQCKVHLIYLKLLVYPAPLLIHYQIPYLTTWAAAWPFVLPLLAAAVAILGLTWRRHPAGFVGLFSAAILAPTFVIPIVLETAAERRMYLPAAAIIAASVIGLYACFQRRRASDNQQTFAPGPRWFLIPCLAMAAVLGIVSARRAAVYRDPFELWSDVLATHSDDLTALVETANPLIGAKRYDEARRYLRQALSIDPHWANAHANLAVIALGEGKFPEAVDEAAAAIAAEHGHINARMSLAAAYAAQDKNDGAEQTYRQVIEMAPHMIDAYNKLGDLLYHSGRPDEAAREFRRAIAADPDDPNGYCNLGVMALDAGRTTEAVSLFRESLRRDDRHPDAHLQLANVLWSQFSRSEAAEHFRRACQLRPNSDEPYTDWGRALEESGQFTEARRQFREVVRLQPELPHGYDGLARIAFKTGNYRQAVEQWRLAIAKEPDRAGMLANLSRALAADGQPAEAIAAAERALALAQTEKDEALQTELGSWLRDYRAAHPSVAPPSK